MRLQLGGHRGTGERPQGLFPLFGPGHGWSVVGGQRFEWEEKDIFCVPSWAPYRHGAYGEAVLFCFNDIPAMKALSLYREE